MMAHPHPEPVQVAVAAIVREIGAKSREDVEILGFWRPENAIRGGVWQLPGGKIEPGESGEVAAARETLEEVGLKVEIREFLGEASDLDPSLAAEQNVRIRAYLAVPADETWDPDGDQVRWIPLSRFEEYPWPRANAVINRLLQQRFLASEPA